MTDRDLLVLAAKAAGIRGTFGNWGWDENPAIAKDEGGLWRPLTEDADAMQLAVGLRISVYQAPSFVLAIDGSGKLSEKIETDCWARDESTRRAIVMVAAHVGRGMP